MDKELKDLIVGVVDNYDWEKIKYWANSIKQSGFDGYKALIVQPRYLMLKNQNRCSVPLLWRLQMELYLLTC